MSFFRGLDAELDAALAQIVHHLNRIEEKVDQMALNLTALQTVVATIKTDTAKNATDLAAIISALQTVNTDPANQAIIDQAVSDLGGVQTSLEATNAVAEKAVPAPTT